VLASRTGILEGWRTEVFDLQENHPDAKKGHDLDNSMLTAAINFLE
jgi:hypothetical protein